MGIYSINKSFRRNGPGIYHTERILRPRQEPELGTEEIGLNQKQSQHAQAPYK